MHTLYQSQNIQPAQPPRRFLRWRLFTNFMLTLALPLSLLAAGPVMANHSSGVIATYNTGLGGNGAEIITVRDNWGVLTNAGDGSLDILNLADLSNIQLVQRIKVPALVGLTSAAIHPDEDYVIAVAGSARPQAAPVVGNAHFFRLSDGALLHSVAVGIQPDAVTISPNGDYALVANEAEGFAVGDNGGPGSLTLLDLDDFEPGQNQSVGVTQLALPTLTGTPGFSAVRTDDTARLPVDNTPATLEPEFVSFDEGSDYAFVTLQENNGVVRLKLDDLSWSFFGLGQTTHAVDLVNDGQFNPSTTETFFREPDGIAVIKDSGETYFVTADEGDTRNGAGGNAPRGGRTVSVFLAGNGQVLGDTGGQLDALAAARGVYPDARSPRGGSEPENLDVIRHSGDTIVAVGLERANAVAFVDISTPSAPVVYDLVSVGAAPEGVKLLERSDHLYALVANEGDGTLSVVLAPTPQ